MSAPPDAPRVTVLLVTYRLGGFDLTRRGLDAQSFTDFELVIVDRLHAYRADAVARFFAAAPYPVRHIKDGSDDLTQREYLANNLGLEAARGAIVVLPTDWTILDPCALALHVDALDRYAPAPVASLGTYRRGYPPADAAWPEYAALAADTAQRQGRRYFEDLGAAGAYRSVVESLPPDSPLWTQSFPAPLDDVLPRCEIRPDDPGRGLPHDRPRWAHRTFTHCRNEAYPAALLRRVGGWDQRYDGCHAYGDIDLGDRLGGAGARFRYDPAIRALQIPPHQWMARLDWTLPQADSQRRFETHRTAG